MTRNVKFDIALSFAGEDRPYVQEVANILRNRGISVFYDVFEEENLWGKNLYDYLSDIYSNQAYYTILFISENYKNKLWTNHERQAMQSRAFQENQEYILPARFDDSEVPGLLPTIGYIAIKERSPADFAEIIFKKLVLSGRTVPSEIVRKSLSPMVKIPKNDPTTFTVIIKDENDNLLQNVQVFLVADNNTYLSQNSRIDGVADFSINTRRNYMLYLAHPNFPAVIVENVDPVNNLSLKMYSSENVGSVIFKSTGYIPKLNGRLNPILDSYDRTYLYADNIAINGGETQPAFFKVNQPFDLEDSNGMIMQVTVKHIKGKTSVLEYVKPL